MRQVDASINIDKTTKSAFLRINSHMLNGGMYGKRYNLYFTPYREIKIVPSIDGYFSLSRSGTNVVTGQFESSGQLWELFINQNPLYYAGHDGENMIFSLDGKYSGSPWVKLAKTARSKPFKGDAIFKTDLATKARYFEFSKSATQALLVNGFSKGDSLSVCFNKENTLSITINKHGRHSLSGTGERLRVYIYQADPSFVLRQEFKMRIDAQAIYLLPIERI